jgi:hypothetical protein
MGVPHTYTLGEAEVVDRFFFLLTQMADTSSRSLVDKKKKKKRMVIHGTGDYQGPSVPLGTAGVLEGLLGFGIQQLLGHIIGFGDYTVTNNSIMGGLYEPPEVKNLRDRCFVVRHREYIADINATSNFTVQSFPINPGLVSSFPWLSQVAQAFEEYYIVGMVYEYKTLSADYTTAPSASLGYVIMATQYNVLNPVFPDKVTMENYQFSNSRKPSETFIHPIECKKSVTPIHELYVRTGAVPAGADPRLYDLGVFQIATGGNNGTGTLGELWVSFEAIFCKPRLSSYAGYELLADHYQFVPASLSNAQPLANGNATLVTGSNLGTSISANVMAFPPSLQDGFFIVVYTVAGGSTALAAPSITYTNCFGEYIWLNNGTSVLSNSGSTANTLMLVLGVQLQTTRATLTFGTTGTLPSSPTAGDLYVTQSNYNLR